MKNTTWTTPAGAYDTMIWDLLKQPHLLIAGTTGSGKSVLLNTIIWTALYNSPNKVKFVLIDPKSVELCDYAELPHTLKYSDELEDMQQTIENVALLMDERFRVMKQLHQKKSTEADVYVIIDEWVDLKFQLGKNIEKTLTRIVAKGRAANIHVILCTQRPTVDVLTGSIRANFTSKVALRTMNKQESRNILDMAGAESLPLHGFGILQSPDRQNPVKIRIAKTSDEDIQERVNWWTAQK